MGKAGAFGDLLRGHRLAAEMTIEELSEASGVRVRAIGDMERGRSRGPQRRTVAALADALRLVPPDREALIGAAKAGRPRSGTSYVPTCELPRGVWDFTGRRAELTTLEDLAALAEREGRAMTATISGGPGLGKTALAVRAAESLRGRFPDGRFFVDLRGMDAAPLGPGMVLSRLLRAFGVVESRIPQDETDRSGYYRSLLSTRRSLIVLDNAADEAQVRPLLPGAGSSLVLITSRRSLAGLEGVHQYPLTEMPPGDAVRMLRTIVGAERTVETGELDAVAGLCGNLPLAMRIAGNRLLSRPGWSVAHLAGRLADEERRLGLLSAGDLHVGAAFAVSYEHLSASAAEMFRRLALVPGPDLGVAMGAVLTETSPDRAEDALEELVELGLLQSPYAGRYRLHDLVRLFARARLSEEEPDHRAARDRMNQWLLDVATVAGRWFEPDYGEPPADFDALVHLDTREEAYAWLKTEGPNWLAALRTAAADGDHARVIEVASAMHWFSDRLVHWGEWREVFELSAGAAHAVGDRNAEIVHLNYLAWALDICEGRREESVECSLKAYELAREEGDVGQQGWALNYAGWALSTIPGSLERAAEYARQTAVLFEAAGDWDGYPNAINLLGECLRNLGRPGEALQHHLALVNTLRDPAYPGSPEVRKVALGLAIGRVGRDYAALGALHEAVTHFRESIPLLHAQRLRRQAYEMTCVLGGALRELGDLRAARDAFHEALDGYLALGDRHGADDVREQIAGLDTG